MGPLYKFAPASNQEKIVFGSERPGYDSRNVADQAVRDWIKFMKSRGIQRVCCLLHPDQLAFYQGDLLADYQQAFGENNICHAPIPDYHLVDIQIFEQQILPFLVASDQKNQPVVVHCSGGSGRTGHVLAAWLTRARGMSADQALSAVISRYRNPREAVFAGNAAEEDLYRLLVSGADSERA